MQEADSCPFEFIPHHSLPDHSSFRSHSVFMTLSLGSHYPLNPPLIASRLALIRVSGLCSLSNNPPLARPSFLADSACYFPVTQPPLTFHSALICLVTTHPVRILLLVFSSPSLHIPPALSSHSPFSEPVISSYSACHSPLAELPSESHCSIDHRSFWDTPSYSALISLSLSTHLPLACTPSPLIIIYAHYSAESSHTLN